MAIAGDVAASVLHLSHGTAAIAVLVLVLLTSLFGGMRATTFVGGAQAIVALLAILVPAILLSVQEYGFPIPQVTFGYALAEAGDGGAEPIGVLAGNALPVAGLDGFNMLALALCLALRASRPSPTSSRAPAPRPASARRG